MDIKKIDKIKAPEDWVEEALNPEKIQGISHRRNSMKKTSDSGCGGSDFPFVRNFCNCGGNEIQCVSIAFGKYVWQGKCHRGGVKSRTNETGGRR